MSQFDLHLKIISLTNQLMWETSQFRAMKGEILLSTYRDLSAKI